MPVTEAGRSVHAPRVPRAVRMPSVPMGFSQGYLLLALGRLTDSHP